jgi:hypothetical protein
LAIRHAIAIPFPVRLKEAQNSFVGQNFGDAVEVPAVYAVKGWDAVAV